MTRTNARHEALTMAEQDAIEWWPGCLGECSGWTHRTVGVRLTRGHRDALSALNLQGHVTVAAPPKSGDRRLHPCAARVTGSGVELLNRWDAEVAS